MKAFVLRRRLQALWARQIVRRSSAVVALVGLVGISLLLENLAQTHVFEDRATELSILSGEALLLQGTAGRGAGILSFRGRPGRVVLVDSSAAELSPDSRRLLRKLGAPVPPEELTEVFFGPFLGEGGSLPDRSNGSAPGCLTALVLEPMNEGAFALRLAAGSDPGGRPVLEVGVVEGDLAMELSTALPAAHPALALGCRTELVLGSFRLVEEPPTRQELRLHSGGELSLTFDSLVGDSAWESGDRLEPFGSSLPVDIDGLQVLGTENRSLLHTRARGPGGLRLAELVLAPGSLEASIHGDFEASGSRRPAGGRTRLSLRLGPIVDRLWQLALASLYLAVFVGLKKAFFPKRTE